MHIAALPVVVPLIGAALLVAVRHWTPRLVNDLAAAGVGLAVVAMCAILLVRASVHPFAYWMGGWRPSHLVTIGISFSVDPIGAGMATFVGDSGDRGDRLLVAVFRRRRRTVPRADAAVHGGDGGLLPDG